MKVVILAGGYGTFAKRTQLPALPASFNGLLAFSS